MATASDDRTVRVWRCRFEGTQPAFALAAVISGFHERTVYSCSWSAGGLLATGGCGVGDGVMGCGLIFLCCRLQKRSSLPHTLVFAHPLLPTDPNDGFAI